MALKIFTGSTEFDLKLTGNPIVVTGRASGGCTSSTGRAEELPVPYQILPEDNVSTLFSPEGLSLIQIWLAIWLFFLSSYFLELMS